MATVTEVRPKGDITWPGGEPQEIHDLEKQQSGGGK